MSIVNEALKKASNPRGKGAWLKSSRQEQSILTVSGSRWRKPLFYGVATAIVAFLAVGAWWVFPNFPLLQKGPATPPAGEIYTTSALPPPSASSPTPQAQLEGKQAQNISDQYQIGLAYYRAKRYNEAEQVFSAILAKAPGQATAHNNLGLVYHGQGKQEDAAIEYLAALRIDPTLAEAMNNLALLYDQQGRAEEAVNLYDRALKIKPDYSEAHLNYAIILERLGYLAEAKSHYQSFLSLASDHLSDVVATVQARLPTLP
jgi:tetratricopeptide (TPR) repeat protein